MGQVFISLHGGRGSIRRKHDMHLVRHWRTAIAVEDRPRFEGFNPQLLAAGIFRPQEVVSIRSNGSASAPPCTQKHTVPGSTTCRASGSSAALTGTSK